METKRIEKFETEEVSRPENETQRVLREALRRFGPNGERWAKGEAVVFFPSTNGPFCALTATHQYLADRARPCEILHRIATEAGYYNVQRWNDAPERTFIDVKAAFLKAIDLAGA